jgi:hypothetical protein
MRMLGTLVLGAGLVALPTTIAWADCTPMELSAISGTWVMQFADLDGSGGPSRGDKRVGEVGLQDADGNAVGKVYWVATAHEVGDDGKPSEFRAEHVLVFQDGALFTSDMQEPAVGWESGDTVMAPHTQWQIVGGTGAYAGAQGTEEVRAANGKFDVSLNLSCE